MELVEVEAVEDRSRAEGGHAVILLRGVEALEGSARFRLRPHDVDALGTAGRRLAEGEHEPLSVNATAAGVALVVGPRITESPALVAGTAVEITLPDAGLRGEFLWPAITPAARPKRRNIMARRASGDPLPRPVGSQSAAAAPIETVRRGAAPVGSGGTEAGPAADRTSVDVTSVHAAPVDAAPVPVALIIDEPAPASDPVTDDRVDPAGGTDETAADEPLFLEPAVAVVIAPGAASTPALTRAASPVPSPFTGSPTPPALPKAQVEPPPAASLPELAEDEQAAGGASRPGGASRLVAAALLAAAAVAAVQVVAMQVLDLQIVRSAPGEAGPPVPASATASAPARSVQSKPEPRPRAPAPAVPPAAAVPPASAVAASQPPTTAPDTPTAGIYDAIAAGPVSPRGTAAAEVSPAKALQLAHTMLHGPEAGRDTEEGIYWLKRYVMATAGAEHTRIALTQLGSAYAQPGARRDLAGARIAWELASALGDGVAMCFLGVMHEHGLGVPAAAQTAQAWYRRAVSTGANCPSMPGASSASPR